MVFISLTARMIVNVEALNMTESVGNFVRHRRAPIIVPTEEGYMLKYVPVVSGETLAHAYQETLAKIANEAGLKVCKLCSQGIFLKHTDSKVFERSGIAKPKDTGNADEVEKTIVENCVVEDVGGFLYTDAALKRTSRIYFGYMIPAVDAITSTAVEAQFHVRYDPLAKGEETKQMIFNIEAGSALYTLSSLLDLCGIGVSSRNLEKNSNKPALLIDQGERLKRVEASLKALEIMITQQLFGAKKTRFNPAWKIVSLAVLVSKPLPLNVVFGYDKNYIFETISNVEASLRSLNSGDIKIGEEAYLYYYTEEKIEPRSSTIFIVEKENTPVGVFEKARVKALELFKKTCGG